MKRPSRWFWSARQYHDPKWRFEQFYINIHNPDFPDGAIRGQLANQIHDHDEKGEMMPGGAPTVPMNLTAQVYSSTALELFRDLRVPGSRTDFQLMATPHFLDGGPGTGRNCHSLRLTESIQYSLGRSIF